MADVTDHPDQSRYEIHVDGELAGILAYHARPGLIALVHTEVRPQFEGRGIGGELVAGALADARERHLSVLPFCEYVNRWLTKHPEHVDLVPGEYRSQFDLPAAA